VTFRTCAGEPLYEIILKPQKIQFILQGTTQVPPKLFWKCSRKNLIVLFLKYLLGPFQYLLNTSVYTVIYAIGFYKQEE
jgi:hypothetical protein